jgi:hypothetical protein
MRAPGAIHIEQLDKANALPGVMVNVPSTTSTALFEGTAANPADWVL